MTAPANPPPPPGWRILSQHEVTSAMTTWAIHVYNDRTTFPMHATTTACIDGIQLGARVEWHTWVGRTGEQRPDGIRGITLYRIED